jgi:hypothetical protein
MSTVFGVWTLGFGCCCGYYYYQFAGYANLFLVGSWVFAWRHRSVAGALVGFVALLLALDTLLLPGHRLDADEGGVRSMYLSRLRIGFYLWLGSILVALTGSFWGFISERRGMR